MLRQRTPATEQSNSTNKSTTNKIYSSLQKVASDYEVPKKLNTTKEAILSTGGKIVNATTTQLKDIFTNPNVPNRKVALLAACYFAVEYGKSWIDACPDTNTLALLGLFGSTYLALNQTYNLTGLFRSVVNSQTQSPTPMDNVVVENTNQNRKTM